MKKYKVWLFLFPAVLWSGTVWSLVAEAQKPIEGFGDADTTSTFIDEAQVYEESIQSQFPGQSEANVEIAPAVEQQKEQALLGEFPSLERSGGGGGQIQEAWNTATVSDGVYRAPRCKQCVTKVRTREYMVTTVILPDGVEISDVEVGDASAFEVTIRGLRTLAIKPTAQGSDTNVNVYTTKEGTVYPLYVRSEGFNSKKVPDLLVVIPDDFKPIRPVSALPEASAVTLPNFPDDFPDVSLTPGVVTSKEETTKLVKTSVSKEPQQDDLELQGEELTFDPGDLHGWNAYRLSGSDDKRLFPMVVFRDSHFTYVQWHNEDWASLQLPTAYSVIDNVDKVVNTRRMGRTLVIEAVSDLIVLKNGKSYLCLQYTGA